MIRTTSIMHNISSRVMVHSGRPSAAQVLFMVSMNTIADITVEVICLFKAGPPLSCVIGCVERQRVVPWPTTIVQEVDTCDALLALATIGEALLALAVALPATFLAVTLGNVELATTWRVAGTVAAGENPGIRAVSANVAHSWQL